MTEAPPVSRRGFFSYQFECRRRPTLPHPDECSTIGAGGLSFRVRDGTGRSPSAKTTDNTIQLYLCLSHVSHQRMVVCSGSHSGCELQFAPNPVVGRVGCG